MTVYSKTEYTCDECGEKALELYEGYMPPSWLSFGLIGKEYCAGIIGTWLYVPLTWHFCSRECSDKWLTAHQSVESDSDISSSSGYARNTIPVGLNMPPDEPNPMWSVDTDEPSIGMGFKSGDEDESDGDVSPERS